jgi:methionine-S-sulfoxide reductase
MSEQALALATFAAGCFWGVQEAYDNTDGVLETTAGYMGGKVPNPTYEQVCKGGTGHVEAVQVKYDLNSVSYEELLEVFWKQVERINLLALDYHTGQYMPVIFYHDTDQHDHAWNSRQAVMNEGKSLMGRLTGLTEAETFYPEPDDSHQHYFKKNPEKKTCH